MTTQRKEGKNQRDFPILVVVTGLLATTWRIVWFLCSLSYVLRHSEHTKKLTVTTWNYTYKSLKKKEIVCNKFSAQAKPSEPFLGRHLLWFDSRKSPLSVSDHLICASCVVAYRRFDCTVHYLAIGDQNSL